jgi:hypothetical protein
VFYGVFIAADTDGAGARAEGDTTLVDVQILMEQGQGLKEIPHWSTYRYSWRPF